MRTPSRFMPQFPEERPHPFLKWIFAIGFLSIFSILIIISPYILGSLILIMLIGVAGDILEKRRIKRLANARAGESICTFARLMNAKNLDTHVVRAVYEEIGKRLSKPDSIFPLRPTDQLFKAKDLNLDDEDLYELLIAIAFRTKRSLENTRSNPYFNKVETVSDLVQFVMAQPRITNS